jgi:hypothetical protein
MAKSDKRQKQMANKRASKDVRFRSALAAGDQGGKSPYQQKIQRKLGNGHRWMWWNEAVGRPQGIACYRYRSPSFARNTTQRSDRA